MKQHVILACAALLSLNACAGLGGLDARPKDSVSAVSGFTPLANATMPASFCRSSAAHDRKRAVLAGFDALTIERIAAQSLAQCDLLVAGGETNETIRLALR